MRLLSLITIIIAITFLISCNNREVNGNGDINPESVYFDYKVWGDEESGNITVRLQYRLGGIDGATLVLEGSSGVQLDGVALKADSSRMNGVYYEITRPVQEFAGKHSIVFTNIDRKKYTEEFNFRPISLRTAIPRVVNRGDLFFDLDGLAPGEMVRVMLNDTVAFSEGINRVDTLKNGRVTITKFQLNRLASGPVHIEFSREDERRVKNGTHRGGRLTISYGLRREFELRDGASSPL